MEQQRAIGNEEIEVTDAFSHEESDKAENKMMSSEEVYQQMIAEQMVHEMPI